MKLLLTSSGITNQTLLDSLLRLAGKPIAQLKLAFIPTAANVEMGDKAWLINNLRDLQDAGFPYIDIVDVAVLPSASWLPRLEEVDIIVMGGGDSNYLLQKAHSSGLSEELARLLETKIYIGISAGSMAAGTDMSAEALKLIFPEETSDDEKGLNLVNFYIIPHFGSSYFPHVTEENAQTVANISGQIIYLLDDETGVEVNGGTITIIGDGTATKYSKL